MNHSFNRDAHYSFLKRCVHPYQSIIIDEDWIKEKNIEMDIVLPFKNEILEEESLKKKADNKKWNDIGLEELLKRELDQNDLIIK